MAANTYIAATKILYCDNEHKLACFTKLFFLEHYGGRRLSDAVVGMRCGFVPGLPTTFVCFLISVVGTPCCNARLHTNNGRREHYGELPTMAKISVNTESPWFKDFI